MQYDLLRILASHKRITIVGDEDQVIINTRCGKIGRLGYGSNQAMLWFGSGSGSPVDFLSKIFINISSHI